MKFLFDIYFWPIAAIVMCLLLFYVPKFAITVICIALGVAVINAIARYIRK